MEGKKDEEKQGTGQEPLKTRPLTPLHSVG